MVPFLFFYLILNTPIWSGESQPSIDIPPFLKERWNNKQ